MKGHWTLDDIEWNRFDASKVDAETLSAVKAAALVEYNATDYVDYLVKVFAGDQETVEAIRQWGVEEVQHGEALGRWAELADPSWSLAEAIKRFRAGYRANEGAEESVRGSRSGEMIARCVVESGTSSFYSGVRDDTAEPVLRQIAKNIAADEFRHYRLFYDSYLKYAPQDNPGFFNRFWIAISRVQEAEDDELAYAYYCGNVPVSEEAAKPYDRDLYSRAYSRSVLHFYHRIHIRKAVAMISKAIGLHPRGVISRSLAQIVWWSMSLRSRMQTA